MVVVFSWCVCWCAGVVVVVLCSGTVRVLPSNYYSSSCDHCHYHYQSPNNYKHYPKTTTPPLPPDSSSIFTWCFANRWSVSSTASRRSCPLLPSTEALRSALRSGRCDEALTSSSARPAASSTTSARATSTW